MENKSICEDIYLLATLLDVIGPEASLGQAAWGEISALDLSNKDGIKVLINNYVLPEYFGSPLSYQVQYLNCLQKLLSNEDGELEKFPMDLYDLENAPTRLFFTILFNEISEINAHTQP